MPETPMTELGPQNIRRRHHLKHPEKLPCGHAAGENQLRLGNYFVCLTDRRRWVYMPAHLKELPAEHPATETETSKDKPVPSETGEKVTIVE